MTAITRASRATFMGLSPAARHNAASCHYLSDTRPDRYQAKSPAYLAQSPCLWLRSRGFHVFGLAYRPHPCTWARVRLVDFEGWSWLPTTSMHLALHYSESKAQ